MSDVSQRIARFRLHDNWKSILKHAWSIRFNVIAALLSGCEIAVQVFLHDPPLPRGTFAILAALVTVAAAISRCFAQVPISGE